MNKKVLAVVVLDESGSMQTIRDKTISCLNEYIQSFEPQGKSCHMTLVKFATGSIINLCEDVPVKDVPKLTQKNYTPNGGTPLLDAVGKTIRNIEENIKNSKDNPDILFIVMTDGEENSSREFDQRQIIDLISEKEKVGWTFVYLGANQDSWNSASNLGYSSAQNVSNFRATPDGVEHLMRSMKEDTQNYFTERSAYYADTLSKGLNGMGISDRLECSGGIREEELEKLSEEFLGGVKFQSKAFFGTNNKNRKGERGSVKFKS